MFVPRLERLDLLGKLTRDESRLGDSERLEELPELERLDPTEECEDEFIWSDTVLVCVLGMSNLRSRF